MTTSRVVPEHYYNSNNILNEHNYWWKHHDQVTSNDRGFLSNRSKHDPYDIIEKDFGDHKVYDYIPAGQNHSYDLSELDEVPFDDEPITDESPASPRRRYVEIYEANKYPEKLPMITSRLQTYSPQKRPLVIKRTYYELTPSQLSEYSHDIGNGVPNEDVIEHVAREYVPKQRYTVDSRLMRETVHQPALPSIVRSPRRSPQHLENQSPSRAPLSLPAITSFRLNDLASPRRTKPIQSTSRTNRESPGRSFTQHETKQKNISLRDILAHNRARRGSRIPKPRREVDEEQLRDPPPSNKDIIKNEFLIHR